MTGTWRITFSMRSDVFSGNDNLAYLYHNGEKMPETLRELYYKNGVMTSTGGREILMMAEKGDTLSLRSAEISWDFENIMICYEFNAV